MTTLELIFLIYAIVFALTISLYMYFAHNAEVNYEDEDLAFKDYLNKRKQAKHA
ncbi:hypothetical protein [Chondrinema litorale]|uniref:hypothetical protein n=1 Tax=Chondrinema litorale TaxID=2994555 RepID=UPI002542F6AC|nr:hypothetical protein [Chondrinema litorale]UZR93440.1 hypothetical protein OQ292_16415 [Chondrinema litorale]